MCGRTGSEKDRDHEIAGLGEYQANVCLLRLLLGMFVGSCKMGISIVLVKVPGDAVGAYH
jgi:hypothetical protein